MNQSIERKIYCAYKSVAGSSDEELYDVLNKIIRIRMFNNSFFEALSPLFLEVAMGNRNMVLKFLEEGYDVNETREDGLMPLSAAVLIGDFFMAKDLLDNGANVNGTSSFNPLIIACSRKDARMLNLLVKYDPI